MEDSINMSNEILEFELKKKKEIPNKRTSSEPNDVEMK